MIILLSLSAITDLVQYGLLLPSGLLGQSPPARIHANFTETLDDALPLRPLKPLPFVLLSRVPAPEPRRDGLQHPFGFLR